MTPDPLREALQAAIDVISEDRDALIECHSYPSGAIDPTDHVALAALAKYDDALAKARAALAAPSAPAEQTAAQAVEPQGLMTLMDLADKYAGHAAQAHAEELYGTSRSYTSECKRKENEARTALHNALAAQPAKVEPQPVDYGALVSAAWTRHKYRQGTGLCIAFKHGAEWQAGCAAPPAQAVAQPLPDELLVKVRRLVEGFEHVSGLARIWEPDYSTGSERALWARATEACADVAKLLNSTLAGRG